MTSCTLSYDERSSATPYPSNWTSTPFRYEFNSCGELVLTKNYDNKKGDSNTR